MGTEVKEVTVEELVGLIQSQQGEFIAELYKKQKQELERIQGDIHKFTLKFDYRNKDMEWGSEKDAPFRTIDKISGKA